MKRFIHYYITRLGTESIPQGYSNMAGRVEIWLNEAEHFRNTWFYSTRPMYSFTFSAASRVIPLRAARSSILAALMARTDP